RTRATNHRVRAVCETDRVVPLPQVCDVLGSILNIDVRTYLIFFFHKAEVSVRDGVVVEPLDSLLDGDRVGKVDKQAMSDDANVIVLVRKATQHLTSTRDHWDGAE